MTSEYDHVKEGILAALQDAPEHRLRPHDLEKALSHRLAVSMYTVQEAIRDLAEDGRLNYTYRDPASYVELPA